MLAFRDFALVDTILRSGSLNKAAMALDMSQPALTKALSTLEAEIGAKLFTRSATGMIPTDSARVFLQKWTDIYGNLIEMRREIDRLRGVDDGVLRIATGYLAATSAEMALGVLAKKFPALRIETAHLSWDGVTAAIRRGDADIGVADPSDAEIDPKLEVQCLNIRKAQFVCRAEHPLLSLKAPRIEDILAYPIAAGLIPASFAQAFPANIEDFGLSRQQNGHLKSQIKVQSKSTVRNILTASDAISIFPCGLLRGPHELDGLAAISAFDADWLQIRLAFIIRKHAVVTPPMAAFMEEVSRLEAGFGGCR